MILADTTFLIDLQRSHRNERHRLAATWLSENAEQEIALPAIVLGEFAEGFGDPGHPVLAHYQSSHRIIDVDERVAMIYSRLSRDLRNRGVAIGANDTWIAATALAHQATLLTRNAEHFERIPGLQVIDYQN